MTLFFRLCLACVAFLAAPVIAQTQDVPDLGAVLVADVPHVPAHTTRAHARLLGLPADVLPLGTVVPAGIAHPGLRGFPGRH